MLLGSRAATVGNEQHCGARAEQQDYFAIDLHQGDDASVMLALADGMGGHAGGAVASILAVDAFVGAYQIQQRKRDFASLRACVDAANEAVVERAREVDSDMGTTLVALCVDNETFRWVSVGDSVVLACQGDFVTRLNRDHNLREELEHTAAAGPSGSSDTGEELEVGTCLTSYLGLEQLPEVDISEPESTDADCFVLASDGLVDALGLDEVGAIVAVSTDAQAVAERLVEAALAKARPNQDNVSVVVLKLAERAAGARRAGPVSCAAAGAILATLGVSVGLQCDEPGGEPPGASHPAPGPPSAAPAPQPSSGARE